MGEQAQAGAAQEHVRQDGARCVPLRLLLDDGSGDFRLRRSLGGALRFHFGLKSGFLGGFLGLAVLVGAAALILALFGACALLAAARFLKDARRTFLGFAEKASLHLLAGGDVVLREALRAAGCPGAGFGAR